MFIPAANIHPWPGEKNFKSEEYCTVYGKIPVSVQNVKSNIFKIYFYWVLIINWNFRMFNWCCRHTLRCTENGTRWSWKQTPDKLILTSYQNFGTTIRFEIEKMNRNKFSKLNFLGQKRDFTVMVKYTGSSDFEFFSPGQRWTWTAGINFVNLIQGCRIYRKNLEAIWIWRLTTFPFSLH